jgi:hypothetical protein
MNTIVLDTIVLIVVGVPALSIASVTISSLTTLYLRSSDWLKKLRARPSANLLIILIRDL